MGEIFNFLNHFSVGAYGSSDPKMTWYSDGGKEVSRRSLVADNVINFFAWSPFRQALQAMTPPILQPMRRSVFSVCKISLLTAVSRPPCMKAS